MMNQASKQCWVIQISTFCSHRKASFLQQDRYEIHWSKGLLCHHYTTSQLFYNFAITFIFTFSSTLILVVSALTNLNPYLPFLGVIHKGPCCLEVPPVRNPWMMKMVPTMMPPRPIANPRAQTTVSVSSDMGTGILGSAEVKLQRSVYRAQVCVCV